MQAALDPADGGRATILIAHRLSTVRGSDRIYVIEEAAWSRPAAMAIWSARGGLYSRLASAQHLDVLEVAP